MDVWLWDQYEYRICNRKKQRDHKEKEWSFPSYNQPKWNRIFIKFIERAGPKTRLGSSCLYKACAHFIESSSSKQNENRRFREILVCRR